MKNSAYMMLMFLVACGGGGGTNQGTAPQISNLELQDDFAFVMAGGGTGNARRNR